MNYSLIATLGPASRDAATWAQMLSSGVDGFRLNTSHLTSGELEEWVQRLHLFLAGSAARPVLDLDLQASKWRLGKTPARELSMGQVVELALEEESAGAGRLPVPHADFFKAAPLSNGEIVLNDAKAQLSILRIGDGLVTARVEQPGPVSARKGITFRQCEFRVEQLSGKDRAIFERYRSLPYVRFAVSYVKDAAEMAKYRALFGPSARLIAKLERPAAVREAGEVCAFCDEIWLCRGDLGAEVGPVEMARLSHELTTRAPTLPKPALLAGQVLEHMTVSPTPTRSEVCCLYDALSAGFRGVVLSDECAVGQYPVEAARAAALFKN